MRRNYTRRLLRHVERRPGVQSLLQGVRRKQKGETGGSASSKPRPESKRMTRSDSVRFHLPSTYEATFQSLVTLPETVRKMDESLQYRGFHTLRWALLFMSVAGLSMYGFRDEIKENIGSTGAELTTRTLSDESVQREARIFLTEVLQYEETRRMLGDLMYDVLRRESTQEAARELFSAILADPGFQQKTSEFFKDVMATEAFRQSSVEVAQYSAHETLNDAEISEHALQWVRSVLDEPDLHSQAGDAIWGALRSTFVPGFLGRRRKQEKEKEDKVKEDKVEKMEKIEKTEKEKEDRVKVEKEKEDEKPGVVEVDEKETVLHAEPPSGISQGQIEKKQEEESIQSAVPSKEAEREEKRKIPMADKKPKVRKEKPALVVGPTVDNAKPVAKPTAEAVDVHKLSRDKEKAKQGADIAVHTPPQRSAEKLAPEDKKVVEVHEGDKSATEAAPAKPEVNESSKVRKEDDPTPLPLSKKPIDIPLNDPADKLKATKPT